MAIISDKGKLNLKLLVVFLQVVLISLSLVVVQTDICTLAKGSPIQSTNLSAGYVKNTSDVVDTISAGVWIAPYGPGNVSSDYIEPLIMLRDPARTLRIVVDTESAVEMGYIGTTEGVLILWPDITNTLRGIAPFDYRERPWYQKASESSQTTWTKPYLDTSMGSLAITCATPISRDGELVGVAGMDVSLASLQSDISLYEDKYLFLVDGEGIVVTRSESVPTGFLWDELPALGTLSDVEKPVSLLAADNSQLAEVGQKMLSGDAGVSVIRLTNGDCQIAYAPLASINWSLGVVWGDLDLTTAKAAQYDEFFQQIEDQNEIVARSAAEHLSEGLYAFEALQLQDEDAQSGESSLPVTNLLIIGALSLTGVLLAGVLGLRVGQRSMKSMAPLFEAFERVGRGEFNSTISSDPSNNTDALSEAFSRMTANLKQRISKLEGEALKKGRTQKEFEMMDDVSKALQPERSHHIEGYDMAYFSADLDGASFYDVFELDNDNVVLSMAGVSGEGFSAAMQAYLTKTLIRTYSRKYQDPGDVLREVNLHINEISGNGMMITCFCGILDPFANVMEYANAGHAFPFVVSSQGVVDTLTGGGIALGAGALGHINLQSDSISVNPGDVLVIYEDRLAEITNEWKEPFGTERLITLMKDNMKDSASGMIKTVEKSIKVHAGNHSSRRDCSLIIVKKNP